MGDTPILIPLPPQRHRHLYTLDIELRTVYKITLPQLDPSPCRLN